MRVALARQNWTAVLDGHQRHARQPATDGEWQYFRARALTALGRYEEAHRQLEAQAGTPTFFGFLAADRLDQPYAICPLNLADDPQREQALLARPGLLRAFELYAVGLPKLARREWSRALQGADPSTLRVAADLASQRGWYDRAVFTLSSGDALRLYDLRFPLASQDGLVPQAEQRRRRPGLGLRHPARRKRLDERRPFRCRCPRADAAAARDRRARSRVATGSTGAAATRCTTRPSTSRWARVTWPSWRGASTAPPGWPARPTTPVPNRVDQWLAARSSLAPDLFVATIPFKETREYVARVMAFSVIYDWRLHGKAVPLATRMGTIGQPSGRPDETTQRRLVDCPASAPSIAPAASSSSLSASP